jgi:lipoprotein-anchoring transpeptidase ErfK/SrfK
MPENDPPPIRLNAPPRNKPRSPKPRRQRPRREPGSHLPVWIAAALGVLLLFLALAWIEMPHLQAWLHPGPTLAERQHQAELAAQAQAEAQAAQRRKEEDAARERDRQAAANRAAEEEKEKAAREQAAAEAAAKKAETPPSSPDIHRPAPLVNGEPPVVQPVPLSPHGAPARALPLDPNVLTTERIAAYQVALERIHFSCGFVDGDQGMRTQRMLRAYQQSRGLPITGFLDPATRAAIGEPGEPFLTYTVTPADLAAVMPKPEGWRAKARAKRLGYNTIWELLAEKFHCTRGYLKALNPGIVEPAAGTELIGPKVYPAAAIPKVASLRVILGETSIEGLDASGRIVAFFPCSIAKDKNKRPNGALVVKSVVPDPDYTFDPELFADAAKAEDLHHKLLIPPGPRNPVGTAWIGLSLPGYGIHGTPDPEAISRTQSHGCFRLANWNATKVLSMVHVGTPVTVVP